MSIFDSIILGVVEGITEFLPISSTGHLILTARLLGLTQTDFLKTFEISIQLGAILSVVFLYRNIIFRNAEVIKRVAAAFIPTAILGLVFYRIIKRFLLGNSAIVIWALFLGGIFLIIFELLYREKKDSTEDLSGIRYRHCLFIGVFQAIAMVPGVSRAAATICGGLFLGLKRKTIVEFSFLLAIPTMLAATIFDLLKSSGAFSRDQFLVLVTGLAVSFIVALFSIKFLIQFIKKNNFIPFGIYRILLALSFLLFVR